MDSWRLRARPPTLVQPVRVDPSGRTGPTPGQAEGPSWRWTAPSTYVPAAADRGIPEQRVLEEASRLPPSGAVTGWAALRLHGAGYFDGRGPDGRELPVPLVVPPGTRLRVLAGTVVHRERLGDHERCQAQGITVTTPERAWFDAARRASDLRAVVVATDMALAAGVVTVSQLDQYLRTKDRWPGVTRARTALTRADARSMSPMESRLRLVWTLDACLPPPRCNWPVADASGRLIGRPDLLSVEHAVVAEFDGAGHRSRDQHREDLRRDDRFRSVGLEPFRVVGADLADTALLLDRIRAAIDRSRQMAAPRTWLLLATPGPVL
ncbi:MAG: hypothetical protein NTV23_12525 [Propionibacteriales bacterium]|nr:hypothetical protein [Propionibacteriales bacterium]